ncbi:MAG: hypothetical protein AMJ79_04270 [Phycisphaerae bacterium SM23_30]|nr:MAG: hypothetical protein AMJ79_04270 [Phycisphaerae bacterium SM23_30]
MKTRTLSITLILVLLCYALGAVQAQDAEIEQKTQETPKISNTRYAQCLLEVRQLPIESDTLESIINATFYNQIARKAFDESSIDYNYARRGVSLDFSSSGMERENHIFRISIILTDRPGEFVVKSIAQELLDETVAKLKEFVKKDYQRKMGQLNEQYVLAQEVYQSAEARFTALQAEQHDLIKRAGQRELYRSRILDEIRDLEQKRQQLEMEQAGRQARQRALEEQIAKMSKQTQVKLSDDPVLAELEKLLKFLEQRLETIMLMEEMQRVKTSEVTDAQESVALTKIDIIKRREEIGKTEGGELLGKWNLELADLAIRGAELEAQLNFLIDRLRGIEQMNLLEKADRFERLEREISTARSAFDLASREVENVRRQIERTGEPQVTILGGK